jgi:hypothetical protein
MGFWDLKTLKSDEFRPSIWSELESGAKPRMRTRSGHEFPDRFASGITFGNQNFISKSSLIIEYF